MRMSCLIATLNPMTEATNPARLIQSPALIFIGSLALIIEKGRATFTLFLGDTTLGTERDLRTIAVPLSSAISQPPNSLTDSAGQMPSQRPSATTADGSVSGLVPNGIFDGNGNGNVGGRQRPGTAMDRHELSYLDLSWTTATPLIWLAGPGPAGRPGPSRRCQRCFPPSPASPDRTAPSSYRTAATARRGGPHTSFDPSASQRTSASWRTHIRTRTRVNCGQQQPTRRTATDN